MARDERSAEMLDLIYANRSYEPIFVFNFIDATAFENYCITNSKDIASYTASNESAINAKIKATTEAFKALN